MRLAEPLSHAFAHFLKEESAASNMEYALVGLLIAVVCILAVLAFRKNI